MDYQALAPVTGTVLSIRSMKDCCGQLLSLDTGRRQVVNFTLSPETVVLNSTRLRPGMRVVAYYDVNLPVPLIFPPQYKAQLISVIRPEEFVYLGYFNRDLTAMDQSLRLNIAPSTVIVTANGQSFSCAVGNRTLLVYYTTTTRSIPPQTTPRKVVVLC